MVSSEACLSPINTCTVQIGEYTRIEAEVKFGQDLNSRVDFVLTRPAQAAGATLANSAAAGTQTNSVAAVDLNSTATGTLLPRRVYIEVKSVTMSEPHEAQEGINIALFPDTVGGFSSGAEGLLNKLCCLVAYK